jgi:hypothetical protein
MKETLSIKTDTCHNSQRADLQSLIVTKRSQLARCGGTLVMKFTRIKE